MARERHLQRAPITEALIDLHVGPAAGLTYETLKSAVGSEDFGYYVKGPISEATFEFSLPADGQPSASAGQAALVGLRLHSTDEKYVAQFRLGGFTLSRLPPYQNWENLVEEMRRLWTIYCQRLMPTRIFRVATRFINNLRLPLETGMSYQTFIKKFVDVPDEVPQAVEAFFQRFRLVDSTGARIVITLTLDSGMPAGGPAPVILDIDAFTAADLSPLDERLWLMLERLHELKNRSFFGTITEEAVELYE